MLGTMGLQIDGLSGAVDLEWKVAAVLQEYFELWKLKQLNYGPGNIAALGQIGVVLRMNDKFERLWNYHVLGITPPEGTEGNRDAWLDMLGYGLIGVLLEDGHWPGAKPRGTITPEVMEMLVEKFNAQQENVNDRKIYRLS